MTTIPLKNFLEIPYEELEELNLEAKRKVLDHTPEDQIKEYYLKYLHDTKELKAVTVAF